MTIKQLIEILQANKGAGSARVLIAYLDQQEEFFEHVGSVRLRFDSEGKLESLVLEAVNR